jgi:hypothetical protein
MPPLTRLMLGSLNGEPGLLRTPSMTPVADRVACSNSAAPDSAHECRSVWPGATLRLLGSVYTAATIGLGSRLPPGRDEVV